jgi:ribosome-associated toxin RatA of RatAB toxin-antitoxin module
VVYQAAKQVTRFPDVLPDLEKVEVLKDDGGGNVRTSWVGTIRVGPMTRQIAWIEDDSWLDTELRCQFELVEGDMKTYDGSWEFVENGGECDVTLRVTFELGVPMLGPMVNRMVDQLMQKNCDELLEALEKLAAD